MISAMPAVAVRREREKNRQGKLIGDPFIRGVNYIPGHQLHHLPTSYYHPHHHHHHHSSTNQGNKSTSRYSSSDPNCVTTAQNEEKSGLRFLVYSGFGCLTIGLICLFIGIVTIKVATQIIGLVFIGLGGLFCIIKVVLNRKASSTPQVTTTRAETSKSTRIDVDTNRNDLNSIRSSVNPLSGDDSKQNVQPSSSTNSTSISRPTACSSHCLSQTSSKPIDQQNLEAS